MAVRADCVEMLVLSLQSIIGKVKQHVTKILALNLMEETNDTATMRVHVSKMHRYNDKNQDKKVKNPFWTHFKCIKHIKDHRFEHVGVPPKLQPFQD